MKSSLVHDATQLSLTQSHICRVGQNQVNAPDMTVH
jgi:hypothetical protein